MGAEIKRKENMKRYKLLRDLPTFKAGDKFFINEKGDLIAGTPEKPKENILGDGDFVSVYPVKLVAYAKQTLDKFPNILTDWFEEIKEDGVDWKPEKGQDYWYVTDLTEIYPRTWDNSDIDNQRWGIGNTYRTVEQAGHARNLQVARTKIRRSSDFVPDWSDSSQPKYCVYYDHKNKCLCHGMYYDFNYGEIVHYATQEDVERAIEELEPEYLMHFGVK